MRKCGLLCFGFTLLCFTGAFAKSYQSKHFIIYSDLDARYVQFIQANSEAYYENLEGRYFRKGWPKPLIIYYSKTQSDTHKLLKKHGLKSDIDYGRYVDSVPAVYTHRLMDGGWGSGWGTLFHEITHHFIELNYRNPPAWFNEGLACFLGEQTRIVKGKLTIGRPNPWREQILRDKIEKGLRPSIKRLFSTSTKQFYGWSIGYHFARAFFYWLHESGELEKYLQNVQEKGYELSVLEETVSNPYGKINIELLRFIKKNCYAGAYLKDGQRTRDRTQKKQAFLKALELKPDYQAAQLELAWCYYHSKDYEKCRENLEQILNNPESIEYRGAVKLMGDCYCVEKDYTQALEYYQRALEYSDYYEYKYELCYWMAHCYHYLKDYVTAKKLYKKFLDNNWEPERLSKKVKYAEEYERRSEGKSKVRQIGE